ncbi:unnamed protein product [Adineta steineri]|uniref:Uncharacterized protein n=1 Tax=Adineta steineri TaxID=433720 RepID=A0A815MNG5_9BILA|nr:unnamed protein product [Adineta steineri]CAF1167745.1 unnamed protein product [Adineta steineri]CAF1423015.1 unnamed protein product [Adineta steineri]
MATNDILRTKTDVKDKLIRLWQRINQWRRDIVVYPSGQVMNEYFNLVEQIMFTGNQIRTRFNEEWIKQDLEELGEMQQSVNQIYTNYITGG